MSNLFKLVKIEEALEILKERMNLTLTNERLKITQARGQVLAENIKSEVNLPPFARSTMDGYAVRAEDTFGAAVNSPIYLDLISGVEMGEKPEQEIKSGELMEIATGGMLPAGADAIVMVEDTEKLGANEVEVTKAVAPGSNIVTKGEDIRQGSLLLRAGHLLRPQDIGALAGIGITEVDVYTKPKITVFSTGDELLAPDKKAKLGQVKDINSYSIGTLLEEAGGITTYGGIISDQPDSLKEKLQLAIDSSDLVVLSGGSSVGSKDLTIEVLNQLGEPGVLVHGIAIKPGKPTVLAIIDETPVIGLPGHPASAFVVGQIILKPLLQFLTGSRIDHKNLYNYQRAKLSRNIASTKGREEYIRVSLVERENQLWAEPLLGKSSLISTLVGADGLLKVALGQEGIEQDKEVEILIL